MKRASRLNEVVCQLVQKLNSSAPTLPLQVIFLQVRPHVGRDDPPRLCRGVTTPDAKSTGVTVAGQYGTADN